MDVHQVSDLLKIEPNDINQLISHGKIKRPNRINGRWDLNEDNINEIKKLPRDALASTQKLFRQKAFWSKKLDGVSIPASVIALTKTICEDPSRLDANLNFIVDQYAEAFVAYVEQTDPSWLDATSRVVFAKIEEACRSKIELFEALALVSKNELISTRQLAAVCACIPQDIRTLWKERRIAPSTQGYAGQLLWRVDNNQIEAIKKHLANEAELPAQKFAARRDIIHFEVTESPNEPSN